MLILDLFLSVIALAMSGFALYRCLRQPAQPKPLTKAEMREAQITTSRALIAACIGAETALVDHTDDKGVSIMLAQYRANAAVARATLKGLGVEA